jgi:hypothetical protein
MSRIMSCDHSLSRNDILKFIYCFMVLFLCNNIVILSLIIFYLNCNHHANSLRYNEF